MERHMYKLKIADERRQKTMSDTLQWRKQREKKKVQMGGIMGFFAPEHLVAASNDMYTPNQVKAIYKEDISANESGGSSDGSDQMQ